MKKILFLTPELPYPPVSGGKLKSWKLVEFLSQQYGLTVAAVLKENDEEHVEKFLARVKLESFLSAPVKVPRSIGNLLKSFYQRIPLNVFRTYSKCFMSEVSHVIHDYDMVIADHYEVFQYIPSNYQGKVVLHEHNAYYLMWERFAKSPDQNIAKRLVSYIESLRVKRYERNACHRADLVFASPNDIDSLALIGVDRNKCCYTYHLGDDSQLQLPTLSFEQTTKSLLYVGSLRWEANVDGLLWFFKAVWPTLKKSNADLALTIIGKDPDPRLIDATEPLSGIVFEGFVENLEPFFQRSRVAIAPLRFGAGMKVKVLSSMCRGIPTVTTSIGSEGMDFENMTHLAVEDNPENMVKLIERLLVEKELWEHLECNSRQLIKEKYTWKSLFSDMHSELQKLLVP